VAESSTAPTRPLPSALLTRWLVYLSTEMESRNVRPAKRDTTRTSIYKAPTSVAALRPTIGLLMRKLFQVALGTALCIGIAAGLIYSPFQLFWEHEDEPHVYSITWRSAVVFLLLLLFTQWISHLIFGWIGRRRKQGLDSTDS